MIMMHHLHTMQCRLRPNQRWCDARSAAFRHRSQGSVGPMCMWLLTSVARNKEGDRSRTYYYTFALREHKCLWFNLYGSTFNFYPAPPRCSNAYLVNVLSNLCESPKSAHQK